MYRVKTACYKKGGVVCHGKQWKYKRSKPLDPLVIDSHRHFVQVVYGIRDAVYASCFNRPEGTERWQDLKDIDQNNPFQQEEDKPEYIPAIYRDAQFTPANGHHCDSDYNIRNGISEVDISKRGYKLKGNGLCYIEVQGAVPYILGHVVEIRKEQAHIDSG